MDDSILVGWKLYYANESIIDSTQMKFDNVPRSGIEVLLKWYKIDKDKYSVEIQSGLDYYVLYSNITEQEKFKLGHNIRKEKFEEILEIAKNDKIPITNMIC